jgi:thiamine-monophosphate kinase
LKLRELGEFGLIERIAGRVSLKTGIAIGIGDDAAAVEPSAGLHTLVTTDMLVEGVHFDLRLCDPVTLGSKSLAVNLSDIAAMGGRPRHFLLSLAIPDDLSVEFLDGFIEGMLTLGEEFGVALIGGDTCSSPTGLVISVTVMGEQVPGLIARRSGARPGDQIAVTGTLGDAALGLEQLKAGAREGMAVARHLAPIPRVWEGLKLAEAGIPSAMIDVSDGLLADLGHILDLSGTGARLFLEKLPLSDCLLAMQPGFCEDPFSFPLSGGEDYELLFTATPVKMTAAHSALAATGTRLTVIGEVTAGRKLSVLSADGTEYPAPRRGYDHFPSKN